MFDTIGCIVLWVGSLCIALVFCYLSRFATGALRHYTLPIAMSVLLTPSTIEKCNTFIVPAWYLLITARYLPRWRECLCAAAIFLLSYLLSDARCRKR